MVPLISIIVPVFNSQDYLRRCLDSLVNQTLNEIEIIVVDDCSTDSSREIIKEYADKFTEKVIAIYRQENHKQGACRNVGIQIAKGDYILFVDSDDWIELQTCEELAFEASKTNCDILCFNYIVVNPNGEKKQIVVPNDFVNDSEYNFESKFKFTLHTGYFVTHIFKRNFILRNQIQFPEDIYYEDSFFNFISLVKAKAVRKIKTAYYNVFEREESTMRKRNSAQQYDRIRIANLIWEARDEEDYDLFLFKLLSMHASSLLYTCIEQFDKPNKSVMRSISNDIKKACPKFHKTLAWQLISPEFRFALQLNSISPSLLIFAHRHALFDKFTIIKRKFGQVLRKRRINTNV